MTTVIPISFHWLFIPQSRVVVVVQWDIVVKTISKLFFVTFNGLCYSSRRHYYTYPLDKLLLSVCLPQKNMCYSRILSKAFGSNKNQVDEASHTGATEKESQTMLRAYHNFKLQHLVSTLACTRQLTQGPLALVSLLH